MKNPAIITYLHKAGDVLRGVIGEDITQVAIKVLLLKILLKDASASFENAIDWKTLFTSLPTELPKAAWETLNDNKVLAKVSPEKLAQLVVMANAEGIDTLSPEDFSFLTKQLFTTRNGQLYYHKGYNELTCGLAKLTSNSKVYTTSPATFSLLGELLPHVSELVYESLEMNYLVYVFQDLFADKATVKFGDIYHHPSFIENGQLQKFDASIAFPPYGMRLPNTQDLVKNDDLNRFEVNSRSSEVLTIQHLMAHSKGRVVVTVPLGILFTQIEKPFRQYLVENGLVEAIILLPRESLYGASIPSAIVVIDIQGGHDSVRFVDVEMAGYTQKDRRAVNLINVAELLEKIHSNDNMDGIVTVSREAISDNDFDLTASRYPLNQAERDFETYIASRESMPLVKLVNFERSLPNTVKRLETDTIDESDVCLYEVASFDVNSGYIYRPSREIMVSSRTLDEFEDCFLQPKDILILAKGGKVGNVAFVSDTVPPIGEHGWVASQFVTVLRLKKSSPISAEALFVFLRSQIGQRLLARFSVGSAIANLPLSSLKTLAILMPSDEEQAQAEQIVRQDIESEQQIQQIEADKVKRYESLWYIK